MQKPKRETGEGALAGVPVALPALTRALKLQVKAGRVGFDWNDAHAVLDKIREEISETEAELARQDTAAAGGEIGDLLFAVVNLARHIGVDAEAALRGTNQKFERRFAAMEGSLAQSGRRPDQATLAEMEDLWQEAKRREGAISTRDPE
jgi:ATP diphosphatase